MNMESVKNNITLIGMPASGKSTVGVILAKILGLSFVDTDLVIQQREGALLCDIISERGLEGFLKAEESAVLSIGPSNTVIATGGSVVYSEAGMEYLKSLGKVVYLKVEKEDLFGRLHHIRQRGVALREGQTLRDLYDERTVLYEKYADTVIEESGDAEDVVVSILKVIQSGGGE